MNNEHQPDTVIIKTGFYVSIFLTVITLLTFGFAITAIPISGVFCVENCIEYPYLDSLSHYPKDYIWMYFAMVLIAAYLVYMVCLHSVAKEHQRIFGRIGLTFAVISSVVLLICYYIQFSVIPPSLIKNETEGIPLLTQYNPNGIFIALEELGYIMMSFSFLFVALIFNAKDRMNRFIKWIFILGFVMTILSFSIITVKYGTLRDYRFEIIVISIDWLVLLVNGILAAFFFKRELKQKV